MADSEPTAGDPSAAAAAAAPSTTHTVHDPTTAPDPATAARRRRRRWPLLILGAAVVVAGLTAGLVAWAPWVPPPVLRPTGLVAGPATATSVSFRWSRPPTGPLPDKYLILKDGAVAGSVAGTDTSYQRVGLTPASRYQYRVVAVRSGKRSPQSAVLTVSTLTPPISQARLQGSWSVNVTYIRRVFGRRHETLFWQAIPACAAGACDVTVLVKAGGGHSFSAQLARAGAVYRGHVLANFIRCGKGSNSFPDPTTLTFRVRVTAAAGKHQWWAATSVAGTMTGTSQYVSAGAYYCPASSFKAILSGSAVS
jgi:hypothetical protein